MSPEFYLGVRLDVLDHSDSLLGVMLEVDRLRMTNSKSTKKINRAIFGLQIASISRPL